MNAIHRGATAADRAIAASTALDQDRVRQGTSGLFQFARGWINAEADKHIKNAAPESAETQTRSVSAAAGLEGNRAVCTRVGLVGAQTIEDNRVEQTTIAASGKSARPAGTAVACLNGQAIGIRQHCDP